MGKIINKLVICAILVLFCMPFNSMATGLGIYIPTVGSGSTSLDISSSDLFEDHTINPDISHFGFGFVLDTKVANPGVFNYRLNIGYESVTLDFNDDPGYLDYNYFINDKFSRYSIDNTFGFAVLQSEIVRLWLGPQIRLSYMRFNREFESGNLNINLINFGIAPVLGANFNLGGVFTLAPELGYRISIYGGSLSISDILIMSDNSYDENWSLSAKEFYLKLNIIFRINDYYF